MTDADDAHAAQAGPGHSPELWRRLLSGQVTEVFTFSARGLVFDLPQTLGLEPISYDAYVYDGEGVARDRDELDRLARELAAQQRWICNAGPLFWARHFATAAQAVLIFPSGGDNESRLADAAARLDATVSRALRTLHKRGGRGRRGGDAAQAATPDDDGYVRLEDLPPAGPAPSYAARLVNFLLSEFPEKTFRLERAEDVRALQTVRALPPGRGKAGRGKDASGKYGSGKYGRVDTEGRDGLS